MRGKPMANNYTQFSTGLVIKAETREWLRGFMNSEWLEDFEADDPMASKPANNFYALATDEFDWIDGPWCGFEWDADDNYLIVYCEDSGDPEPAAFFIQRVLEHEGSNECVLFEYAFTCSKPRAGEFGGGAAFITRDTIEYLQIGEWFKEQKAAWEAKQC
jgi:hypothetical protein